MFFVDLNLIGEDLNDEVMISGKAIGMPRLIFYGTKFLKDFLFI
jgi:hypothetical protein